MPYPEHARLREIHDKSQAISDFLDWLADPIEQGDHGAIELAYYPYITERPIFDHNFSVIGYTPLPRATWERSDRLESLTYNRQQLLARFFGVDLHKLEEEKVQMLAEFRDNAKE